MYLNKVHAMLSCTRVNGPVQYYDVQLGIKTTGDPGS